MTAARPTNECLRFEEQWPEGRKTAVVEVRATSNGALLGVMSWFGRWRQYAFHPAHGTTFNQGCLAAINAYLASLMEDRRG